MRKLLSLRHWVHVFKRVWMLLKSPQVPVTEKLLFSVPALLYVALPDVLPLIPIDDIAVVMLLASWFASRMEKKYKL